MTDKFIEDLTAIAWVCLTLATAPCLFMVLMSEHYGQLGDATSWAITAALTASVGNYIAFKKIQRLLREKATP